MVFFLAKTADFCEKNSVFGNGLFMGGGGGGGVPPPQPDRFFRVFFGAFPYVVWLNHLNLIVWEPGIILFSIESFEFILNDFAIGCTFTHTTSHISKSDFNLPELKSLFQCARSSTCFCSTPRGECWGNYHQLSFNDPQHHSLHNLSLTDISIWHYITIDHYQ